MLPDYQHFEGRQRDTAPLQNALAYQGITAPHTGQPLTQALLFGVSGGIVAGYFTFEYQGYDPALHFITRNSFEPTQTIMAQLGVQTKSRQTDDPARAIDNLKAALESGKPLLVFGYDANGAHIADRSRVPLYVDTPTFAAARGRVKSNKNRVMTIESIDLSRLPEAVENGIRATIRNMTEKPPKKPMEGRFGLVAYQNGPNCWRMRKAGRVGRSTSRRDFADFLDEAAVILSRPALKEVANGFRKAAQCWESLETALLPDMWEPLKETRELIWRQVELFIEQGGASLEERRSLSQRLKAIRQDMETGFPLSDAEAAALRDELRAAVLAVHDSEAEAIARLKAAMA